MHPSLSFYKRDSVASATGGVDSAAGAWLVFLGVHADDGGDNDGDAEKDEASCAV